MADEAAVAIGAADVTADVSGDATVDLAAATDTKVADAATADDAAVDGQQDAAVATEGVDSTAKLKGLIESLKPTDPAAAKELKNLLYGMQAIKAEIPGGLPEIRQMKQALDEIGGADGIQGIKAERAEWQQIDEKFAAGDASVLDIFAKENPEGFAKLIPQALDKLAVMDKDAYNHALGSVFVSTLDSWNFGNTMATLADNLSRVVDDKNQPILAREVAAIKQFIEQYNSVKQLAAKAPEKKVDAAEQKLAGERAQLASERLKMNSEAVASATQIHAQKQYETLIGTEARNQKLNIEDMKKNGSYGRFVREIDSDIGRSVAADKPFVQKIQSLMAAGKRDDAVKLSNAKFDALASKAVQKTVREWAMMLGPSKAKVQGAAANGTPATPGVKKLTEAPDTSLVDKSDPEWRNNYMMHSKAKLTTGQRVEWS